MGFRRRPDYGEVLAFINEGEPLNFPLPNRKATIYTSSHFFLDEFPQSTEPLVDNPRPHTDLGAAVEGDFYSADEDGYRGRAFPQVRRPNFLGPGSDTDGLQGAETIIAAGAAGLGAAQRGQGSRCVGAEVFATSLGAKSPDHWQTQRNRGIDRSSRPARSGRGARGGPRHRTIRRRASSSRRRRARAVAG